MPPIVPGEFNFGQVVNLIEKLYKDGGSTDATWQDIVAVYKGLHPDEQLDQLSKLEDCDPDIPTDDIPNPRAYKIDHDAGEICIGGCEYERGTDTWVWTHFDEIRNAVLAIRSECNMPHFMGTSKKETDDADDIFDFLDNDDKEKAFSIPSEFEGGITVASTAKLEELQNEIKLLEAADNLSQAKIRCLEKRIAKSEKK